VATIVVIDGDDAGRRGDGRARSSSAYLLWRRMTGDIACIAYGASLLEERPLRSGALASAPLANDVSRLYAAAMPSARRTGSGMAWLKALCRCCIQH